MDSFLDDLEFYCTAPLLPPKDTEYQAALEEYRAMEAQIEAAMETEFLNRFAAAAARFQHWETLQTFQAGLRFSADFVRAVWVNPPRSRSHSAPTPP